VLTLKDLRRRARNRLDDKVAPYLWDQEELDDYINDALRDAAIRANLVVEDDYSIAITAGTTKYALPSSTLKVKSVRLASNLEYTLTESSIRQQEQYYGGRADITGTPLRYALDKTKTGTGEDYGIRVRAITFLETPDTADTAYVDIVRLPALLESEYDAPEIDEIWHSDLIFGIEGYAYLKQDADTYDPKKSEKAFERFEARFGPRIPAVVMRERQTDVPLEMVVY
jgi:hypothetical protein